MATFIKEEQMINNNAFMYEDKLNSQYTRFLERPPVFVTYYSISDVESMADLGFQNVEAILGGNSPIRFNKIESFPVYGLDRVILNLEDDEEGLTTSYDSELIILPNTIEPTPHDFFIINHIQTPVLFMVTEVSLDTIKSNNFFKIGFTMKSLNPDGLQKIEKQVVDNFDCIFKNIGTEDKCLIRSEDHIKVNNFLKKFDEISEKYFMLFYDEPTNSLLYQDTYYKLYDAYLTEFITRNKILQNAHDYRTITLMNEDYSRLFPIKYEKSIYRSIEKKSKERLPNTSTFIRLPFESGESVFVLRRIKNVMSVNFGNEHEFHNYECTGETYLSQTLLHAIKFNDFNNYGIVQGEEDIMPLSDSDNVDSNMGVYPLINPIYTIIVKYFNNIENGLYDEDINNIDADDIEYTFDSFITTGILLFIMVDAYRKYIKN